MILRFIGFLVMVGCIVIGTLAGSGLRRGAVGAVRQTFPVEGLVHEKDGGWIFEAVPTQDRTMLHDLGLPGALGPQDAAQVRHLVMYLDCHYFFLNDGRVLVISLGGDGRTPSLVDTKVWHGPPHGFHEYRKELLPST